MSVVASLLLLAFAAVNAFGAWAVSRRRSDTAKGFMAAAVTLVVAAVAVAFGHWSSLPFSLVGVLVSVWVSALDARLARGDVVVWRHVLVRAAAGALVVAAVLAARPGSV